MSLIGGIPKKFATGKSDLFVILALLLSVSLGCNIIEKADSTGEQRETARSKGAEQPDVSDDDDFDLTMIDEDESDADSGRNSSKRPNITIVKFRKGNSSRRYSNAVIRGERHSYVLEANKGQKMSVNVSSIEDNAGFYIKSPRGKFVGSGTDQDSIKSYNGILPASGKYRIFVVPTRGNATYKINFTVTGGKSQVNLGDSSGGVTKVVKFRKGRSSASYSNAVVRGDRDTYVLGASGGQLMSVSISSLENNAAFSVTNRTGKTLVASSKSWSGRLPADGKYRIIVGGTRGNATYKINFTVK